MHRVNSLFGRLIEAISTPRPIVSAEPCVYIQHSSLYPPTMVSRFYLVEDLDPTHYKRVVDELGDIDEDEDSPDNDVDLGGDDDLGVPGATDEDDEDN